MTRGIQLHFPIDHVAQQANPPMRANGHILGTVGSVIILGKPNGMPTMNIRINPPILASTATTHRRYFICSRGYARTSTCVIASPSTATPTLPHQ